MRTGNAAVEWARSQTHFRTGYCLIFSRSAFGVASRYGTAALAWRMAQHKHTGSTPPAAVPVFWTGGSHGYGHIAVSLGGGLVRSTDWPGRGRVSVARISDITRAWGLHYAGWSEDLNGVRVYTPPNQPAMGSKAVRLSLLKPGLRNSDVTDFQHALRSHGMASHNPSGVTGYYGDETTAMCKAFQQSLGFPPADADGTPGPDTLQHLGLTVAP